ncbi:hypothetical protein DSUL_80025 [Desulfovibrionales bacterium]
MPLKNTIEINNMESWDTLIGPTFYDIHEVRCKDGNLIGEALFSFMTWSFLISTIG